MISRHNRTTLLLLLYRVFFLTIVIMIPIIVKPAAAASPSACMLSLSSFAGPFMRGDVVGVAETVVTVTSCDRNPL